MLTPPSSSPRFFARTISLVCTKRPRTFSQIPEPPKTLLPSTPDSPSIAAIDTIPRPWYLASDLEPPGYLTLGTWPVYNRGS
ncbi:hypothetical protein GALMADRAFT_746802 [Galerina marginata CBS 339.88]|uniref:Uncharacterized protein n=1 Tax=Galerina marginata (strain CBS 339.88) TaxID=685588 RepID=A0A067SZF2_GALM3|nr:hypothetical protein GALMADRAFT_746802 [Galerina marginata CBS 339.88]